MECKSSCAVRNGGYGIWRELGSVWSTIAGRKGSGADTATHPAGRWREYSRPGDDQGGIGSGVDSIHGWIVSGAERIRGGYCDARCSGSTRRATGGSTAAPGRGRRWCRC
eukprot:1005209-Prorocentrum_minimum.AAC.1